MNTDEGRFKIVDFEQMQMRSKENADEEQKMHVSTKKGWSGAKKCR